MSMSTIAEQKLKIEYDTILEALKNTGFNKSRASKILGVDRKTLYHKLKKYDTMIKELEIPPTTIVLVTYKLPNKMVVTFDENKNQVPGLQGLFTQGLYEKIKKYSNSKTIWNGF